MTTETDQDKAWGALKLKVQIGRMWALCEKHQVAWDLRLISDKYGVPFSMVRDFYSKNGSIPETQVHYSKLSVMER